MNLSGVRPGSEAGHGVELLEQAADDFVGICMGTQAIKLAQHARQRFFNFADRVLGIELTLLIEAALALDEFFPVKVREGMYYRIARRPRVGQEARNPVP